MSYEPLDQQELQSIKDILKKDLPKPPDRIWERIENECAKYPVMPKRLSFPQWTRWPIAAAAAVLIAFLFFPRESKLSDQDLETFLIELFDPYPADTAQTENLIDQELTLFLEP